MVIFLGVIIGLCIIMYRKNMHSTLIYINLQEFIIVATEIILLNSLFIYIYFLYLLNSIFYFTNKIHIYIKCRISKSYYTNKYFIPLCNYDNKYKKVNLFGYFKNGLNKHYSYKSISFNFNIYNNTIKNNYVNITFKRVKLKYRRLSLCIVSIYKNINIFNLIRTCLLYKKLGVEHITLYISYYNNTYNYQLKWLKNKNWIDIIDYKLPDISFFYYGQDSKLNHCINHYRYFSKYVIVTDIDEVIIPQNSRMIMDVIDKYGRYNFVFSFKSVLFCVNNTFSNIFQTSKTGYIFRYGYEKMILRPEKIISIGAHFPKIWQERGRIVFINIKDAYVRHARVLIKRSNCSVIYESDYFTNLKTNIEEELNKIKY